MSVLWDETRRQEAREAGISDAVIDEIETRRVQEQATRQQIELENARQQRTAVLSRAFDAYYNEGEDPGQIADWVEQNAGREAAVDFVAQWQAEEAQYNSEPTTPEEWLWQRQQDDAELERVAEVVRQGMAEKAQREHAEHLASLESEFKARHPEAADSQLEGLLVNSRAVREAQERAANGELIADSAHALGVLEAGLREAKAQHTVGELAARVANESSPSWMFKTPSGLLPPNASQEEKFPTAESLAAKRAAYVQQKAEEIYAREAPLVDALAEHPKLAEQELADEAARWAAKSAPRFNGGLVVTGAATAAEQKEKALQSRGTSTRAAIAQIEGHGERRAAFHAASIPAAEPESLTEQAPEPHPAATPRSWWLHD